MSKRLCLVSLTDSIVCIVIEDSNAHAEECHLNVSHPKTNRGLGLITITGWLLQNLFKVNSGKSRRKTCSGDRDKSSSHILLRFIWVHSCPFILGLPLRPEDDDGNTDSKGGETNPLFDRVSPLKHDHGYDCSGEQLRLVCDLEKRCGKITQSNVKQCILQEVQETWYNDLESVKWCIDDIFLDALEQLPVGDTVFKNAGQEKFHCLTNENEVIDDIQFFCALGIASIAADEYYR
mmetsp:Transcript_2353/g.3618  ORF Transcript_2353/g.3618 Transcript_2353/m.3618 type:complete len:235 (-) Transcript_2353:226-930(-)